jgi:succinyl-diaminopimelate desuccinylase
MLIAARAFAKKLEGTPGIVLVLTASEENGCVGSRHLAALPGLMGKAGAIVVGEPTSNYPMVGHKGSIKLHAHFQGVSAHGSMPHLGVNAIYKAARAIAKLEEFKFGTHPHPVMGEPTMNVGTFAGGSGVNLVPDSATVGIDIRTVAGMDHAALLARLKDLLGEDAKMEVFADSKAVWTAPDAEWVQRVFAICKPILNETPEARTAPYMTDAANLLKVYAGAPTVVLGPGEAAMAHQTDEYCNMERIRQSVAIYEAIIGDWCRA